MKLAGDVAGDAFSFAERMVVDRVAAYESRRQGRPLRLFVAAEFPGLEEIVPAGATVRELVEAASDQGLEDAAARVRQCRRCTGAACEPDHIGCGPGWTAMWKAGRIAQLPCAQHAEWRLAKRLEEAGVAAELARRARFDSFVTATEPQETALERARQYATDFRKMEGHARGLYLAGGLGVGKTHLAVAVMAELVRTSTVRRPYFAFVPEFLERIRASFKDPQSSPVEEAKTADLLVLDDLAGHATSEWVQQQLAIIVNTRWGDGRPTVVTTNADPSEMDVTLGARTSSRLDGMMRARVLIDGSDQRRG